MDRFKLFGLIPAQKQINFISTLRHSFEELDFLTGRDFCFALGPGFKIGLNETEKDYFGIWETDKLLSPMNSYKTSDESISIYSITAQTLNIEFDYAGNNFNQ